MSFNKEVEKSVQIQEPVSPIDEAEQSSQDSDWPLPRNSSPVLPDLADLDIDAILFERRSPDSEFRYRHTPDSTLKYRHTPDSQVGRLLESSVHAMLTKRD